MNFNVRRTMKSPPTFSQGCQTPLGVMQTLDGFLAPHTNQIVELLPQQVVGLYEVPLMTYSNYSIQVC